MSSLNKKTYGVKNSYIIIILYILLAIILSVIVVY